MDSNAKTFLTASAKMEGGRIVEGMQVVGFRNVAKKAKIAIFDCWNVRIFGKLMLSD